MCWYYKIIFFFKKIYFKHHKNQLPLSQTPLYGQHKTFAAYQNSYKAQNIHADWAIMIFF
jgi:hypothetical protein